MSTSTCSYYVILDGEYFLMSMYEMSSFGHIVSRCAWLRCSTYKVSFFDQSASGRSCFEPCHYNLPIAVFVSLRVRLLSSMFSISLDLLASLTDMERIQPLRYALSHSFVYFPPSTWSPSVKARPTRGESFMVPRRFTDV